MRESERGEMLKINGNILRAKVVRVDGIQISLGEEAWQQRCSRKENKYRYIKTLKYMNGIFNFIFSNNRTRILQLRIFLILPRWRLMSPETSEGGIVT